MEIVVRGVGEKYVMDNVAADAYGGSAGNTREPPTPLDRVNEYRYTRDEGFIVMVPPLSILLTQRK
jgi:hypothetical protein